jgi:hypothetical protein
VLLNVIADLDRWSGLDLVFCRFYSHFVPALGFDQQTLRQPHHLCVDLLELFVLELGRVVTENDLLSLKLCLDVFDVLGGEASTRIHRGERKAGGELRHLLGLGLVLFHFW